MATAEGNIPQAGFSGRRDSVIAFAADDGKRSDLAIELRQLLEH